MHVPRCLSIVAALLLVVGALGTTRAQSPLAGDPGYVDLSRVDSWFDADPTIAIDVEGELLSLVSDASHNSDPEFARLLRDLKAIHVRGYSLDDASIETIRQRTDALAQELERQGWSRALFVRDDDSTSRIYLRQTDDGIAGLTALTVDDADGRTVFINVVGPLHPDDLNRLGDELDVDGIDDMPRNR